MIVSLNLSKYSETLSSWWRLTFGLREIHLDYHQARGENRWLSRTWTSKTVLSWYRCKTHTSMYLWLRRLRLECNIEKQAEGWRPLPAEQMTVWLDHWVASSPPGIWKQVESKRKSRENKPLSGDGQEREDWGGHSVIGHKVGHQTEERAKVPSPEEKCNSSILKWEKTYLARM